MNPLVRSFRAAAAHACQRQRFPFDRFMGEYGLEGVLLDADANHYTAKQLVVAVLTTCCVHAGKFNNFTVGLQAVFRFLADQYGPQTLSQVQAYRDLIAILDAGGDPAALSRWLDSNFP